MLQACSCASIGAKGIRFCPACHRYWVGDRELDSVSRVISQIFPKKSWDGVDKAVVEHARIRGERVDAYACEYIRTGNVAIQPGEWKEVRDRVDIVCDWIDATKADRIETQQIAYSEKDGVASTKDFDVWVGGSLTIIDLKNTYQAESSWKLQLGCQAAYSGDVSGLFVLHVSPSVYGKKGCRLLPYDLDECSELWKRAVEWYKAMKTL